MYERFKILPCGDRAIMLEFGEGIDIETHRHLLRMFRGIQQMSLPGIVEAVPCYRSLLVYYDPLCVDMETLERRLEEAERISENIDLSKPKRVEIPVAYGGELGPDMDFVAGHHSMSVEEVIALHTKATYVNSMYGFDPGFVLLMGLPEKLETPRMDNPRLKVPGGSVGIGAAQTGVYPFERAGGWRLIGRTPLKMFDLSREPSILVDIGDEVKFVRISEREYHQMQAR